MQLFDVAQLISHYLLPCRDAKGILHYINKRRASKDENPIKVLNIIRVNVFEIYIANTIK